MLRTITSILCLTFLSTAFNHPAVKMSAVANSAFVQVVITDKQIRPSFIRAVESEPLKLHIENRGKSIHNLVIPAFYIFTQNLRPGESVDVSFSPEKTGLFDYYSDKNSIPEPALKGKLQVVEK
ncbi:cupredoxin domain-containing protein [Alicyclobacillus tolerans]|uniref:cupredoxin domain-containing protein n=1 Tax=Alicyclobacillus tolerans TaxID=90970 RepID=UPI003B7DFA25